MLNTYNIIRFLQLKTDLVEHLFNRFITSLTALRSNKFNIQNIIFIILPERYILLPKIPYTMIWRNIHWYHSFYNFHNSFRGMRNKVGVGIRWLYFLGILGSNFSNSLLLNWLRLSQSVIRWTPNTKKTEFSNYLITVEVDVPKGCRTEKLDNS